MEFTINKEELNILLSKAAGTVSSKDVNPILKTFLIKAEVGKLQVMATDMSLGAVASANVNTVTNPGVTAAPAKKLVKLVEAVSDKNQIFFKLENLVLTAYTEYKKEGNKESFRSKTVLHCMDPDVYPEFPEYKEDEAVETDLKQFLEGMSKISFASADTELKKNLMAVHIENGVMYSADGARACRWVVPGCKLTDLTVPNSAVHLLVKLLRESTASGIKVHQNQFHILFKIGGEIYHCRKIESKFPDLEKKVFAKTEECKFELSVPKSRLKEAVKAAKVTADEESNVITMNYEEDDMGGEGRLIVKSSDTTEDSFIEYIPGCSWNGPTPFDKAVNFEYLEDAVGSLECGTKTVKIAMGEDKGARKSMYVLKDGNLTAVIMPVRSVSDKKEAALHKRVKQHADVVEAKENMGAGEELAV